jgi:hypothetical protein
MTRNLTKKHALPSVYKSQLQLDYDLKIQQTCIIIS